MDIEKVDTLIKFALSAAGQEDFESRELGPIHLVKYIYLADFAYSRNHRGETYTRVQWKFHHFGPWASEVFLRIKPTLESINAKERKISSPKYEEDFYRWSVDSEELYEELYEMLPLEVSAAIKKTIHDFGNDTAELLHYVYRTRPMVQAAPGEYLSFVFSEEEEDISKNEELESSEAEKPHLSVRQKKLRKAAIEKLRETVNARLDDRLLVGKKRQKHTPPRYDEVYYQGIEWLDRLTGEPMEEEEGVLEVSGESWRSSFRTKDDLS